MLAFLLRMQMYAFFFKYIKGNVKKIVHALSPTVQNI